jgi:hypothetical protein
MLASGTGYIIAHESEKKMDYIDYGWKFWKWKTPHQNHLNFKPFIVAERK